MSSLYGLLLHVHCVCLEQILKKKNLHIHVLFTYDWKNVHFMWLRNGIFTVIMVMDLIQGVTCTYLYIHIHVHEHAWHEDNPLPT